MVIESAEVVPGQDNGRVPPLLAVSHDRVDLTDSPVFPGADAEAGVIADREWLDEPAHGGQLAGRGIGGKSGRVAYPCLPIDAEADVPDGVVGVPEVPGLALGRGVVVPRYVMPVKLVAQGGKVE